MSPRAILSKIAEIIGNGRYLKYPLKKRAAIAKVKIPTKSAETREFPPLFIFRAVRTNTAETGSHQAIPEAIFERESPRTSLSLLNPTLVIRSAILADMMVSKIATIAIATEVEKSIFERLIKSANECISIPVNGNAKA